MIDWFPPIDPPRTEVKPALDKVIGEANALITELNALAKEAADSGVYPAAVKPIQ